jgi:hypothetical protein
MLVRAAIIVAAVCLTAIAAYAQPSDATITKDLTWKGVKKVELNPGPTKKEWNGAQAQYMWARGATVYSDAGVAKYPAAVLVQYGYARYHYGESNTFREFKLADSHYEGIPAPSKEEILGMVRDRYRGFLAWRYHAMVGDLHYMRVAEEEGVLWHTPNSFTARLEIEFDHKSSYTEVTTTQELVEARFYRDDVDSPWKDDIIGTKKESKDIAVKAYSKEEIDAMLTFANEHEEREANARVAALPTVSIPEFPRDVDVFLYTHKMLREGTRAEVEAYLMNMLAEHFFVEGSTTRLTDRGADLINNTLDRAFNPKSSYAQQYCADPGVKHQQTDMMEWWNATQDAHTRMALTKGGGTWKNGQKVGESYKISALEVFMLTSADDIARINSYEPGMLCKPASGAQKAVPRTSSSSTTSGSNSNSSTTGTNDMLNKGKGLLNKITKP